MLTSPLSTQVECKDDQTRKVIKKIYKRAAVCSATQFIYTKTPGTTIEEITDTKDVKKKTVVPTLFINLAQRLVELESN